MTAPTPTSLHGECAELQARAVTVANKLRLLVAPKSPIDPNGGKPTGTRGALMEELEQIHARQAQLNCFPKDAPIGKTTESSFTGTLEYWTDNKADEHGGPTDLAIEHVQFTPYKWGWQITVPKFKVTVDGTVVELRAAASGHAFQGAHPKADLSLPIEIHEYGGLDVTVPVGTDSSLDLPRHLGSISGHLGTGGSVTFVGKKGFKVLGVQFVVLYVQLKGTFSFFP